MAYNHHLKTHFGSCRLLKVGRDPHRERDVKIHAIPGEFDVVGISDGTDSWIAPIATGFLEDVRKALVQLQAGGNPGVIGATHLTPTGRRVISLQPPLHQLPVSDDAKRIRRVISLQA